MRTALCAAATLVGVIASNAVVTAAEDIDPATLVAVTEIATRDYVDPDAAIVSGVQKSRARNGMGYCGEVTLEDGEGVSVFHVLLESTNGPSVLLAADYPETDTSPNANTVRHLMKAFGCVE